MSNKCFSLPCIIIVSPHAFHLLLLLCQRGIKKEQRRLQGRGVAQAVRKKVVVRTATGRFAPKQHPVVMTEGVAFVKDSGWCESWVQWYVLVTNPRSVRG